MSDYAVLAGILTLAVLLISGIPVGLAMISAGLVGLLMGFGPEITMDTLATTFYRESASYSLAAIPLFVLMGTLGDRSQIWARLFEFVYRVVGRLRGGLGMAIVAAGGIFGAVSGSSTAGAAALGKIVVNEAERYGYDRKFTLACTAASAAFAVMIPPSITFIVYALMTQTSVARLFLAGMVPGIVSALAFMVLVYFMALRRPESMPRGKPFSAMDQARAGVSALPVFVVIAVVLGGIYSGTFTPTEGGAVGAFGIGIAGAIFGRQYLKGVLEAAREAASTTAMIFFIIVGAFIFSRFLSINRIPQDVAGWVGSLPLNRFAILAIIVVIYLLMGCFMDQLAIQVLTLPIIFPLITAMQFDPYWFAVIFVMTVEIGLITPPFGLNVYVLSSVTKVRVEEAFRRVTPFVVTNLVLLVIFVAVPEIVTWLPNLVLGPAA